eukprot:RCo023575
MASGVVVAGRTVLREVLTVSAKGDVAKVLDLCRANRGSLTSADITAAIYGLGAPQRLSKLLRSHQHSLVPAYKALGEVQAEQRWSAAMELLQETEQGNAEAQSSARTAVMHVATTCGYHSTRAVPQLYSELGAAGLKPTLRTSAVVARSLLLLKQYDALESYLQALRHSLGSLPFIFSVLEIDMLTEQGRYADAAEVFRATVAAQQSGSPLLFDAVTRATIAGKFPPRLQARILVQMYQAGVLPHQVAPLTWRTLVNALHHETRTAASLEGRLPKKRPKTPHVALKETFLPPTDPVLVALLKKGGIYTMDHVKGLLSTDIQHKLRMGEYPKVEVSNPLLGDAEAGKA